MFGFIGGLFDFLHTMPGEDFLLLCVVWLLVIWLMVLFLRAKDFDTPITTAAGLILFEGLGLARLVVGSAYGMHRWGFMIVMMIGGSFFLHPARREHFRAKGGRGSLRWLRFPWLQQLWGRRRRVVAGEAEVAEAVEVTDDWNRISQAISLLDTVSSAGP